MNDRELLELLASEAPAPRQGYVDEVLRRGRRARTKRRAVGVGVGVAALAVLAGSVTVLSGQNVQPAQVVPSATARVVSAESEPYLTAIRTVAGKVPELYVRDGFCDVMSPMQNCRPGLPAPLRDDIAAAIPGVRFVPVEGEAKWPMVTIGELRREGEFVDIPISIVRTLRDGEGKTYRLKRVGEQWQVTGTVGGVWIA